MLVNDGELGGWMTSQLFEVRRAVAGVYAVLQNINLTDVELRLGEDL